MATSEADVQTAVRGGCAIFKRMITNLETRIRSERQRLANLRARLREAEGQSNPDLVEIERLKEAISTLQGQIDQDETDLAETRVDFEMFCSG
jgi:chromosome segregation ATPase